MAENTKIEWADHTFNPWQGCTKVSPGCDHCYAEARQDKRLHVVQWGPGQPRKRTKTWGDPVKWNKAHAEFFAQHGRRQRVFCASLADVFDNEVDADWRADLLYLISETPNLDWLLLTKRIGNAERMVMDSLRAMFLHTNVEPPTWPWPNVWLGATIVNQEEADRDIPKLLATPARVRFLSTEPLLGPVDLRRLPALPTRNPAPGPIDPPLRLNAVTGDNWLPSGTSRMGPRGPAVDWVIVGGESGPGARPMHPDWARSLRDQCKAAGVPFLFKQWGEHAPTERTMAEVARSTRKLVPVPLTGASPSPAALVDLVGKRAAGRLLDGVTHDSYPEAAP